MQDEELRECILKLLKEYRVTKRQIALLRFEWVHPQQITEAEILDVMTYSKGEAGGRTSVGHVSDKTYHIAVNYKDAMNHQNKNQIAEISTELEQLEKKVYRLEYCVEQLPEEQGNVIKKLYFEGKGQKTVVKEFHLSESTVQRYRDRALDALVKMYEVLINAGAVLSW